MPKVIIKIFSVIVDVPSANALSVINWACIGGKAGYGEVSISFGAPTTISANPVSPTVSSAPAVAACRVLHPVFWAPHRVSELSLLSRLLPPIRSRLYAVRHYGVAPPCNRGANNLNRGRSLTRHLCPQSIQKTASQQFLVHRLH